jgi:hypothetical protein
MNKNNSIQRKCGAPGCDDPDCHDPKNHGFDAIRPLRGRTVYYGKIRKLKRGTGTSTTTRKYVNSTAPYPKQVSIECSGVRKPGKGGRSEFINQPLAKGQKADAGHIFGRQYGGFGNQKAAVFPQHPQTNRGNKYKGAATRHLWREHEDNVRSMAHRGLGPRVAVTIRDQRRLMYQRACVCGLIYPLGAKVCTDCGRKLT